MKLSKDLALSYLKDASRQLYEAIDGGSDDVSGQVDYLNRALWNYKVADFHFRADDLIAWFDRVNKIFEDARK